MAVMGKEGDVKTSWDPTRPDELAFRGLANYHPVQTTASDQFELVGSFFLGTMQSAVYLSRHQR